MSEPKRLKLARPTVTPILADDLCEETPLVDVYVGTIIDPKTTSAVVLQLNSAMPLPQLAHLKRVRGRQVLLLPQRDSPRPLALLAAQGVDVALLAPAVETAPVAAAPPKTRRQHARVRQLWPCNFHPDPRVEKLAENTLFSDAELRQHAALMRLAFDVRRLAAARAAAVVAAGGRVVACGFDQRDYPTQHAVMVAVDNVAKTQRGGVWPDHPLRPRVEAAVRARGLEIGGGDEPYLCTGYSVYCTHEPCISCAMALVHSRAKRVFYSLRSERGGLGSLCKIHVVDKLNHHYEAFADLLPEEWIDNQIITPT